MRTIATAWGALRESVLDGLDDDASVRARRVFYAGAQAMLEILDDDELSRPAIVALRTSLYEELATFGRDVQARRA